MSTPNRAEIARALTAAGRWLRLDASAAFLIGRDNETCRRSFFAAILCLPAFFLEMMLVGSEVTVTADELTFWLVWGLIYLLAWVVFPVFAHAILKNQGREAIWPHYISTLNWCSVLTAYLGLGGSIIERVDALPFGLAAIASLLITFYLLFFEWFIARKVLQVTGPAAAGFVALNNGLAIAFYMMGSAMTGMQPIAQVQ